MSGAFLLYGSYGYTGDLIARHALARGLRPVLAGRNATALARQAETLGLTYRAFTLDDAPLLDAAAGEVPVVLNCAGPFSRTARPMVDGCLRVGTHYVDITGEIDVFEALAHRRLEAKAVGVMLLPGAGFDVVPSDCLAAHLARRLPSAVRLTLAFQAGGAFGHASRGTLATMVENLDRGGVVRQGGRLTHVPAAWRTREVDFGDGVETAVTIPWGDVATAYYSTGIENVEVYAAVPARAIRLLEASRRYGRVLGAAAVKRLLGEIVRRRFPAGPSEAQRRAGTSRLWGEACDHAGRTAVAHLRGPDGYTLTARTAVAVVERVLAGHAPAGFQTPSLAYGADFVLGIDGVTREDVC